MAAAKSGELVSTGTVALPAATARRGEQFGEPFPPKTVSQTVDHRVIRSHGLALHRQLWTLALIFPFAASTTVDAATPAAKPVVATTNGSTAGPGSKQIDQQFEHTVKPFVGKYCEGCHSGKMAPAQFDLKSYTSLDMVTDDFARWSLLADRLKAKEMPPKPMPAPPAAEAQQIIDWVAAVRAEEIRKADGDPGIVMARRLSNAEYDYTIRDLTGQNMQVARQFPVDPANQAGFDNSGESLTMSSALLNKYLKAATEVADHAALTPNGLEFAPYPTQVETDREKYAIQRILAFYAAQPTNYVDYFEAAWRYKYRKALKNSHATLASTAADAHVSSKYLPMVWQILNTKHALGPVLKLQQMFLALPAPTAGQIATPPAALRAQTVKMRDFVVKIRTHTAMQFAAPVVAGLPGQSQPLLNWKLKQFAESRRLSDAKDLRNDTDAAPVIPVIPKYPKLHEEAAPRWAALSAKERAGDTDLIVPHAQRAQYEAAFAQFANVFPDTFYVTERGRYFPDDSEDKGRLLSAGYHSVAGYYRDDLPLVQLVLNDEQKQQLDQLWNDADYMAAFTARTWTQFFFNQCGEVYGKGDEATCDRPTDHAVTDTAVVFKIRDAYLAKAAADPKADPVAAQAIREHFEHMDTTLRGLEKEKAEAESKQLDAVLAFAARAYRRPLTAPEKADLLAYYHDVRSKDQLSHEDAVRNLIVSVLMEPDFLYRLDVSGDTAAPTTAALHGKATAKPAVLRASAPVLAGPAASEPLSSYALASRLSYFLWASMPDAELLRHAAANDLQDPAVLLAQTRRMMKDDRVKGLATEFTGNWLAFRLFETNNSVDRMRFPQFNNDLREAMFEEPVRYVEDAIRNDRSVLDLLFGNYTFVNPVLAKHYGIPGVQGDTTHWIRIDDAGQYGRGGILPMAVFMTQSSPGLRTSPVKRGNWVVQKVLGIRVPPPPPVVPELPSDESKTDLPIRQMLARHHENPFCASCHERFDSFGLAYEGYGPIGDARTKDLAGRPVDTAVVYPGGFNGIGFIGLQNFIRDHREEQFLNNLCRKLLSYSLNRSLQLSDEALIDRMQSTLQSQGYKFDPLIETVVMSPQFRNKRVAAPATDKSTQVASVQIPSGKSKQ